jgi:hypothetical protein
MSFNGKSFFEHVVERTKKLERLLEQNYQAFGNGLGVKARSVEDKLDSDTIRQLRFIVSVRNKIMHEDGYVYDGNADDFLRKCDEIIRRLSKPPKQEQTYTPPPPKPGTTANSPPPPKVDSTPRYSNTTSNTYSYSSPSPSRYTPKGSSRVRAQKVHKPLFTASQFKAFFKVIFIVIALIYLVKIGSSIISSIKSNLNSSSSSTPSSDRPQPQSTVQVEKIGRGRTPDEKMYQFTVPSKKWVETSIKIKPNQEVLIHHFTSNEQVTVNIAGMTDSRLHTPGTMMPLYTSTDCSRDRGVQAKVQYYCVQLSQPESVKLYAEHSVPVGIYIRNR